jgi:hypothetical protein
MKPNILLAVAIGAFSLGCEQKPTQEVTEEAAHRPVSAVGGGWLKQAMASPEFRQACAETPGCGVSQESISIATEHLWRVRVMRQAAGSQWEETSTLGKPGPYQLSESDQGQLRNQGKRCSRV